MDSNVDISRIVEETLRKTAVCDMHTHLFPPTFHELALSGIDDLLAYHYLAAEVLRIYPSETEQFWQRPKADRAEWIWRELFQQRTPISEACRGVLTVLRGLGLDTGADDLSTFREYFRDISPESHLKRVFDLAGVKSLVMTNDPFDLVEQNYWQAEAAVDPRFRAALRLDVLLNDWPAACRRLRKMEYDVDPDFSGRTFEEIRRFLETWDERIRPLYLAVSLPPDFAYPELTPRGRILKEAVLPFCRESRRPLAMMIGVKRNVNPDLGIAGDGLGRGDIGAVERLCDRNPGNRFLVTMLSRENQHDLAVTARKFGNLMPFGCWWFMNVPGLITETTAIRLDLLGLDFIPQHSDSRVLEQLIYKWSHSREAIAPVLADRYEKLAETGWRVTETEIQRDMEKLLVGNFERFVGY